LDFKWSIKWNKKALDDLKKIDVKKAKFIKDKVEQYLVKSPLELGEKMQHVFKGFYRYRIGSYRVIYSIIQTEVLILVLSVGKRDEIYD
jgi:mRNA interferase RelE/StbE